MEVAEHIAALGNEAELFAGAADQAGLQVNIVHCPGWNMRDLVRHLSEIHLWAAGVVSKRAKKLFPDDISEHTQIWPDLAVFWPEDEELVGWYLRTNANLVNTLESAPADLDTMTFLPAPSPRAMWARRQAHETAVHRFDAEHAAGIATNFDPVFAADGVDEILAAFAPRKPDLPTEDVKTMMVHATDTDDRWHVTLAPDGFTTLRGDGPADVTLAGRATDLYLALWNRGDSNDLAITGDHNVLAFWHNNHRVRWS